MFIWVTAVTPGEWDKWQVVSPGE